MSLYEKKKVQIVGTLTLWKTFKLCIDQTQNMYQLTKKKML